MTRVSSPNISPNDQAQMRAALARLNNQDDTLQEAINDIAEDVSNLESSLGKTTLNFQDTVVAGEPVFISNIGEAAEADATSRFLANVVGLSAAAVTSGAQGDVITTGGQLTLADWSAVTGSVSLEPGKDYFLSTTPGMLTTTAPEAENQVVCRVGSAISLSRFEVNVGRIVIL